MAKMPWWRHLLKSQRNLNLTLQFKNDWCNPVLEFWKKLVYQQGEDFCHYTAGKNVTMSCQNTRIKLTHGKSFGKMTHFKRCQDMYNEADKLGSTGEKSEAKKLYSGCIDSCETLIAGDTEVKVSKLCALAYNNRGHLKYLEVDFDGAVEDYSSALKLNTSLAVAFYNRGLIHYRLGRFAEAVSDQEQALKLDPSHNSAKCCLEQSQIELSTDCDFSTVVM